MVVAVPMTEEDSAGNKSSGANERHTLAQLLDSTAQDENVEEAMVDIGDGDDKLKPEDVCVDCLRMPKELHCEGCEENFCRVCFQFAHRGGKRKDHTFTELVKVDGTSTVSDTKKDEEDEDKDDTAEDVESPVESDTGNDHTAILRKIRKNIKFIPMRLTYDERQLLKLLEAALTVSEYTDKVDIISYTSKTKRIITQLKEMCSILAGLVVSSNMKVGQQLIEDKNFVDNADWYKTVFEIGRRYKVMNPERMRDTYGKLCYIIMDSRLKQVKEHMEFDLYKPIMTIERYLQHHSNEVTNAMFNDLLMLDATADIRPEGKSRNVINRLIKQKERAIELLANKYHHREGLNKEQIRIVLYSIGDFHSYTNKNRFPVLNMSKRLDEFFADADAGSDAKYSLGIKYGYKGSRLTHNHEKQYLYVKQALGLWNHVMRDLIELWYIADDDLFDGSNYRMADTGQGLQRIKACPKLYKKMYSLLHECQSKFDYWVGIPVIHLGDDAVPNALFFLDKYIQIPSILIPIDKCVEMLPTLARDPYVRSMFESQFGSVEELQKDILCDYFKHGFDGSGADNYYFAGSCVDASSTSSCEFCNNVAKKPYYKVFLLSGFTNFNGEGY